MEEGYAQPVTVTIALARLRPVFGESVVWTQLTALTTFFKIPVVIFPVVWSGYAVHNLGKGPSPGYSGITPPFFAGMTFIDGIIFITQAMRLPV